VKRFSFGVRGRKRSKSLKVKRISKTGEQMKGLRSKGETIVFIVSIQNQDKKRNGALGNLKSAGRGKNK